MHSTELGKEYILFHTFTISWLLVKKIIHTWANFIIINLDIFENSINIRDVIYYN